MKDTTSPLTQRINVQKWIIVGLLGALPFSNRVTDHRGIGRAVAYAIVALFVFLIALAVYFWGSVFFGGILDILTQGNSSGTWGIGISEIPKHDIDPGLELLAAGILVYRMGEVRPEIHFRKVPLGNARAMRPFIVARTGSERPYQFLFSLTDDHNSTRFESQFTVKLGDALQLIMPQYRLAPDIPRKLVGQRWSLQVKSGVTVITSFRFMFIDSTERKDVLGCCRDPADQALGRLQDICRGCWTMRSSMMCWFAPRKLCWRIYKDG
jgi:hypothetical protein